MAEEDGRIAGYRNVHRAFLQALLSRPTITYAEAKPLLAAIETAATPDRPRLAEDVTQDDFENYIHALNEQISAFDLEIRSTRHQTTKQEVYALVNTTSDALTQIATMFTPDEIAFVKRVLDHMFEKNNTREREVMAVLSNQALKVAKAPSDGGRRESGTQAVSTGLTMMQAERALANLVSGGWFELSARGFYSLTPRALMELRGWLVETYNEERDASEEEEDEELYQKIKFCMACKEIVTVGQRCPKLECAARLHDGCVQNMFRAQGGNEQCPLCRSAWADPLPVGEQAARGGSRAVNGSASDNPRGRSSVVSANGADDESDATSDANG